MQCFDPTMIATAEMIIQSLNPRQQKFVEFYVSGIPAGRSYERAGYSPKGNAADAEASRLIRNPKVFDAIQREREDSRRNAALSRDCKLSILSEIALNRNALGRDRIAAIRLHNEMTGEDAAPPVPKVDHLKDIRERAKNMVSAMVRPAAEKLCF
jgi:phage terminase small subunit